MILVIGVAGEVRTDFFLEGVTDRDYFFLNAGDLENTAISLTFNNFKIDEIDFSYKDFSSVVVVTYSTFSYFTPKEFNFIAYKRKMKTGNFINSLLYIFSHHNIKIINPTMRDDIHRYKFLSMFIYNRLNIKVPDSLLTNDIDSASEFCNGKETIFKPDSGLSFTKKTLPEYFTGNSAKGLKQSHTLFQERITGQNIRVYVLGSKAICSLKVISDEVDSRLSSREVNVIDIPPEIEKEAVKVTQIAGLYFSGIDLILSNGDYYFLDCNSMPWYHLEGKYAELIRDSLINFSENIDQYSHKKHVPDFMEYVY